MRTLLLTGTALAALLSGIAGVSAQGGGDDQLRKQPNMRQEQPNGGRSETAPGRNRPAADDAATPGRSESAPGQNRPRAETDAPGRSESAPGQTRPGATGAGAGGAGGSGTDEPRRIQPQADDQGQRDRDRNRQAEERDGRGNDTNRRQADDQNLRERDRNRQAEERDGRGNDANRRQADDQNLRERDRNRQAEERDGRGNDANRRQADDQDLRDRDRNRQADDQNQRDRDRNRQAGDDRRGGDGDAKLSVKLKGDDKIKITANLAERGPKVERTKIKFKINVGTTVPRDDVRLAVVPESVVAIVPQYRGYRYFVVDEEIVIVEPDSYRIVEVVNRSGESGATGSARLTIDRSKFSLIKRELRPHGDVKVKFTVREGATLPGDVELYDVPQTVVTEVPELRSYRYVVYQDEVVLVEPESRRIVEVIQ